MNRAVTLFFTFFMLFAASIQIDAMQYSNDSSFLSNSTNQSSSTAAPSEIDAMITTKNQQLRAEFLEKMKTFRAINFEIEYLKRSFSEDAERMLLLKSSYAEIEEDILKLKLIIFSTTDFSASSEFSNCNTEHLVNQSFSDDGFATDLDAEIEDYNGISF